MLMWVSQSDCGKEGAKDGSSFGARLGSLGKCFAKLKVYLLNHRRLYGGSISGQTPP
jgi:hypothetical protein